jgi:sulfite exporter TauE/SafE
MISNDVGWVFIIAGIILTIAGIIMLPVGVLLLIPSWIVFFGIPLSEYMEDACRKILLY